MEMLQLKYFLESAKSESFTQTANKYMVSATSVSAAIKRLEKELGCELFDRISNRISLNTNGKIFMKSVQKMFSELNYAFEKLIACENDTREIRILVRELRSDVTDQVIAFKKEHPNVGFRLEFDLTPPNFEKYDIIIDSKNNAHLGFESFELYSAPLALFANSDSPLCKKKLCLRDLSKAPFISWGDGSNMQTILIESCKKVGFVPDIFVMANDMKCHERFIESGIGIGISRIDTPMLKKRTIKALEIKDFDVIHTVHCYYKAQSAYGNIKMFLNFLKNIKDS